MDSPPVSLTQHILQEETLHSQATGEFSSIMVQIAMVGKMIARDLRHAGLTNLLGSTGGRNVQGEVVQILDERANALFVEAFDTQEVVRTLVSEEMEEPHRVSGAKRSGKYALYFDPLDGSSNIDVNAPLGSIFSIHRLESASSPNAERELFRAGTEQVAAGYLLYGTSTLLMYSCGAGVHQFTLDPELGEFFLSAKDIHMPARGKIYSANEGNYQKWSKGAQRLLDTLKELDAGRGCPYAARYTGCLVADVHRILLKGGIYLYPGEQTKPEGKLRLLYEAAPLTFLIEQAGGCGSTGCERIRNIQPKSLHQRVPLYIGSREEVELAEQFVGQKQEP